MVPRRALFDEINHIPSSRKLVSHIPFGMKRGALILTRSVRPRHDQFALMEMLPEMRRDVLLEMLAVGRQQQISAGPQNAA